MTSDLPILTCSRGHITRHPNCPACHTIRIAAWDGAVPPATVGEPALRAIVRNAIAVHYEGINGTLEDVLVSALSASLPPLSEQDIKARAAEYLSRTTSQHIGRLSPDDLVAFVQSLHRPPDGNYPITIESELPIDGGAR